jgi:hypothetical protein
MIVTGLETTRRAPVELRVTVEVAV